MTPIATYDVSGTKGNSAFVGIFPSISAGAHQ